MDGSGNDIVACSNAAPEAQAHYIQLYQVHYPRVTRLCRLLLADAHEAEDVAQEVFIKLWLACQTETRAMAWEPWLTRVTVNACRDRRRSGWWKWWRAPRRSSDADGASVPECLSHGPTPEEDSLAREVAGRIWQAFRELPSRQQEVFALRYLEGRSTEEVADALCLSVGSVKQHLYRAVHRLRRVLGGEA
jgi:RNA polymerase sigma-70 factor (ECF subfamily)